MKQDAIIEIGIDGEERLYIKPSSIRFPYMYREALEVQWNSKGLILYGSKPRKWSYLDWYNQIIRAAREQSCELTLNESTSWFNISDELKSQIMKQSSVKIN